MGSLLLSLKVMNSGKTHVGIPWVSLVLWDNSNVKQETSYDKGWTYEMSKKVYDPNLCTKKQVVREFQRSSCFFSFGCFLPSQ